MNNVRLIITPVYLLYNSARRSPQKRQPRKRRMEPEMSEDNRFRGRLFGGFNRQDVVSYIERSARLTNEYKTSNEALESRCDELSEQLEDEKALNESLKESCSMANSEITRLTSRLVELENELNVLHETVTSKDDEITALHTRLASCDEAIGAYETSKERIALLELNASRRAVNIEKLAEEKADNMTRKCQEFIASVKAEYELVCNDTESTVAHITGEMDRLGRRLFELSEQLAEKTGELDKLNHLITRNPE